MNIIVPNKLLTLSVSDLQIHPGDTNMYSVGFRNLIENHLNLLRILPSTKRLPIDPKKEHSYCGDFYNLLYNEFGIAQDILWVVMRVNHLNSPLDYTGALGYVTLPSRSEIEQLLRRYLNSTTI
jgi:hypothetical protein